MSDRAIKRIVKEALAEMDVPYLQAYIRHERFMAWVWSGKYNFSRLVN